jgi:hypothetical protein
MSHFKKPVVKEQPTNRDATIHQQKLAPQPTWRNTVKQTADNVEEGAIQASNLQNQSNRWNQPISNVLPPGSGRMIQWGIVILVIFAATMCTVTMKFPTDAEIREQNERAAELGYKQYERRRKAQEEKALEDFTNALRYEQNRR